MKRNDVGGSQRVPRQLEDEGLAVVNPSTEAANCTEIGGNEDASSKAVN